MIITPQDIEALSAVIAECKRLGVSQSIIDSLVTERQWFVATMAAVEHFNTEEATPDE